MSSTTQKVGLVLVSYNRIKYLNQCIDSLLQSDLTKLGMLCCVDDCSTEDVMPHLRRLKGIQNTRVVIAKTPRNSQIWGSLYFGHNYLYEQGCDVMLNLDADAIVNKNWLNRLPDLHSRFPNDIISGFNTPTHPVTANLLDYYMKRTIGGINMVFTRNTYADIVRTAYEYNTSWDWEVSKRASYSGRRLIVSKPSVIQHIGYESVMGHVRVDVAEDFTRD